MMKAVDGRFVEVVNPMVSVPLEAIPTFAASVGVVIAKLVTVTVLPMAGRMPFVVDAVSS